MKLKYKLSLEELSVEVIGILKALGVPNWRQGAGGSNSFKTFVIDDFGVVICISTVEEYDFIHNKITLSFIGWRTIFITTGDNLGEKRDEVLWALMRSGYMKWLRSTYNREFNRVLINTNLSTKIIQKRLSIWGNRPRYKFLVADNKDALKQAVGYMVSTEPSFFDYMPEEEVV